jgi:hypothetical protein
MELLDQHQELFQATTYAVQSSVPVAVFKEFVNSLKAQTKISVTKGNAASLSLLAREFFLAELSAECAAFSVPVDPISSLSDRVCQLELRVASISKPPGNIAEKIESQERKLESLRREIDRQRESIEVDINGFVVRELEKLRGEVEAVKASAGGEIGKLKSETAKIAKSVTGLESLRREFDELKLCVERLQPFPRAASPTPVSPVQSPPRPPAQRPSPSPNPPPPSVSSKPQKTQSKVEIPMKEAKSLDGIISYLTKKHGGNVQEKGIVTITSKSVYDDPKCALKNVADLTSDSYFCSTNEPGQWVCWDFREMRVRPTHYTIRTDCLKSWVVEGSLDGSSWTEIDRQTDNYDFNHSYIQTASFAVSKPAEFRFIRLTQIGTNHFRNDQLGLAAVEFFGALSE